MVSVVIPCFNGWGMTHSLLMDIYKQFPSDTEVIVVDDCSTQEDVQKGLGWWKESMLKDRLRIFRNEVNSGFLRSSNFGASKASNDVVALISNDVKINEKVVPDVLDALKSDIPTLVGNRLLDYDTGWNKFGEVIFPYLEGWFLAFRKEEWTEFGGFDERFRPFDFEDVDISTTYLHNNGKLVCIDADMVHLGAQTYKYSPEREAQTKINQEKFKRKWTHFTKN